MEVIAKNKEDYIGFSVKVPVDSCIDKNGEEKDKLIELRFINQKPSKRSKEVIWIRGLPRAAIRPAYQKRSLSL